MKKLAGLLTILFTLSASNATFAESNSQGFYAGTNLGYSTLSFLNIFSTNGVGYNLHGGYMFNSNFGAELGYSGYYYDAGAGGGHVLFQTYDISAKGVYNINSSWSFFGKLGATSIHAKASSDNTTDSDASGTAPLVGLGAGYTFNKNIVINAGWSDALDLMGVGDLSLLYLGIDYHF